MATGSTRRGRRRTAAPSQPQHPTPPVPAIPVATTRGNRNRRAPARYRDTTEGDTEFIDIDVIEEDSSDDDSVTDGAGNGFPAHDMPAARTAPNPTPAGIGPAPLAAAAAATTPNPGSNIPMGTSRTSERVQTTADVNHFYEKSKGQDTICKVCRHRANDGSRPTCRFNFSCNTSNYSLRTHIANQHLDEYLELAEQHKWSVQIAPVRAAFSVGYSFRTLREATQQGHKLNALPPAPHLAPGDSQEYDLHRSSDKNTPAFPEFSISKLNEYLVKFIVADDQSLNVIECPEFRQLLLFLRQDLRDSDIPHRTKLRELVLKVWDDYFVVVKQDLAKAVGKVSFTADTWSDKERCSYLAMTAHWIASEAGSLKMKASLIAFQEFPGQHTGEALAKLILELLDRAEVTLKIGHFTMDNASNNLAALRELAKLLHARDIQFDPIDRRISCFPHVINICVTHTVEEYLAADFSAVPDTWDGAYGAKVKKEEYTRALAKDPIHLAREIVRVIRASGQRRKGFRDTIVNGNANEWYTGNPTQVPVVELLRDVKTRWDSIYFMINRLRALRLAVDSFLCLPRGTNDELSGRKLSTMQWEVLQDLEVVLEVPHTAQQYMSSESNPVLGWAIPSLELLMIQWEQLSKKAPHCAPFIRVGLKWARKYYERIGQTRAYVVAMFIDPTIRLSWIDEHWKTAEATKARADILQLMTDYRNKSASQTVPQDEGATPATGESRVRLYSTLATRLYGLDTIRVRTPASHSALQSVDQEFNAYALSRPSPEGTRPLPFWELARNTFPTIYAIALDYLPIQASAVPCERVFSSSSETNTRKRNSIAPVLMETLQLLKFWLKKERLDFTKGWITSQKEMIADEGDEDLLVQLSTNRTTLDEVLSAIARVEGDEVPDATDVF